jgi:DNA-binding MarR family transcriptional regulator
MKSSEVAIRDFRKNLRALEREVQLSMASDTGCCGVSLAQCHLLLEVEDRGQTSITALADILELDKSTLSRTVDGMCRSGLLNREIDPANRRQQIISLTPAGKAKAETVNSLCDGSSARLFDFIPAASRQSVVKSVALVAEAMRHMRKSPGTPCCGDQR